MAELNVHVHVLFPEDLDRRLRERAEAEGKSKAQVIRDLCARGLQSPTLEERLRALEALSNLGIEVGDPEDLCREIEEARRQCLADS